MMRAPRFAISAFLVGVFAATTACGPTYFSSGKGIVSGLAGRTWRQVVYLEPSSDAGVSAHADGRTHLSFDAASTGDRAVLVATLYDAYASTPVYRLYGRTYREQVGLAESGVGADFVDLASAAESAQSLGAVGALGRPTAQSATVISLQTAQTAAAQRAVCRFTRNDWGEPSFGAGAPRITVPSSLRMQSGPMISSVFDSLGQVYTAYVETTGNDLRLDLQALGGSATSTNLGNSESSVGVADRQVSLAFDGAEYVCALWQDLASATTVNYRCESSLSGTINAGALSSGGEGWGHSIAGGGGVMMAAYFAEDAEGVLQVWAHGTDDGIFSGDPVAVSDGLPAGYEVWGSLEEGGAPQVIALDSGLFMVAWSAATSSRAGVFYSVYAVADDTWTTPELVGTTISYSGEMPIDSFHLFTDGNGGAGIAIRYLSAIGDTRDTSTRRLLLSRYHRSVGWLSLVQRGNGCTPAVDAEVAGCSHRPVGVILDSGAAVVLFQDQDGDGYYRWSGVEFR